MQSSEPWLYHVQVHCVFLLTRCVVFFPKKKKKKHFVWVGICRWRIIWEHSSRFGSVADIFSIAAPYHPNITSQQLGDNLLLSNGITILQSKPLFFGCEWLVYFISGLSDLQSLFLAGTKYINMSIAVSWAITLLRLASFFLWLVLLPMIFPVLLLFPWRNPMIITMTCWYIPFSGTYHYNHWLATWLLLIMAMRISAPDPHEKKGARVWKCCVPANKNPQRLNISWGPMMDDVSPPPHRPAGCDWPRGNFTSGFDWRMSWPIKMTNEKMPRSPRF